MRAFAARVFCHVRVTTFPALPSRHTYNRYIRPAQQTAPMGGEMSQQYPNQPQQPGQYPQPQWGQPTQPMWGAPPQPPKKRSVGKIIGLGCAGVFGFVVVISIIAAVATSGGNKTSSASSSTVAASHDTSTKGTAKTSGSDAKASSAPSKKAAAHTVEFKVWGTAPAGALGGLDIQYGSDTDTRKGTFKNGKFTGSVPFKSDAMYYQLNAQLQGSGDVHCSVTVDGHTKTGHAAGGFNICMVQLNSGLFGDWS